MKKILLICSFLAIITTANSQTITSPPQTDGTLSLVATVFPCDVNRVSMKFEVDSLASIAKISFNDAQYLYKNNELKKEDLRTSLLYSLEEKEVTDGLKINIKEIKIGSRLLHNVDAIVTKGQEIPLILGRNITIKVGKISLVNNDFNFSLPTQTPFLPVKIDLTNDEFSANLRKDLVDLGNREIRNNLVSNLRRSIRSNEKDKDKELRFAMTFKVDLYTDNKNDEKYNEELTVNQKTVTGKMMYETFKLLHTSEETKAILEFYDTTSFNIVFIYLDKTIKFKHILSRESLQKLEIPYTKEIFLQSLNVTKKK